MKKTRYAWLGVALCLTVSGLAIADVTALGRPKPPTLGGGGEIPTPFISSNQRVELSDGELYTLIGTIEFYDDLPYFKVDLEQHAWLANQRRIAVPYYALESSATYWRRFENRRMRVYVEARGHIVNDANGTPQYTISLQPLADPVPAKGERAVRPRRDAR